MNVHTTDCVCKGRLCHPAQTSVWTRDQIRTHAPYYNGTPTRFCLGLYLHNLSRRGQQRPPVRKGDLTPQYFRLIPELTRRDTCLGCSWKKLGQTFSNERVEYTRAKICIAAKGEFIHHRENDKRLTSLAYSHQLSNSYFSIHSKTAESIESAKPIMCTQCDDTLAYSLKRKLISEDETIKHITVTSAAADTVAFGLVVATTGMSQNVYRALNAIGVKLEKVSKDKKSNDFKLEGTSLFTSRLDDLGEHPAIIFSMPSEVQINQDRSTFTYLPSQKTYSIKSRTLCLGFSNADEWITVVTKRRLKSESHIRYERYSNYYQKLLHYPKGVNLGMDNTTDPST